MWLKNLKKCEALFFWSNKISSKILTSDHHEKNFTIFKKLWFERKKIKWNILKNNDDKFF
jgi:hypothetical protein